MSHLKLKTKLWKKYWNPYELSVSKCWEQTEINDFGESSLAIINEVQNPQAASLTYNLSRYVVMLTENTPCPQQY